VIIFNNLKLKIMEEEIIYTPKELLFMIYPANEGIGMDDTVAFTTKECWAEIKACSDDLGGHNMPGELLIECGVQDGEYMESMFETTGEFSLAEVREKLLAAGFEEDPKFTAFMLKNMDDEDVETCEVGPND